MKGSSATRARVISGLAVGLGLLTVGLKVGALLLRWPFAHDATLVEGVSESLLITLDVPYALVGALICAELSRTGRCGAVVRRCAVAGF